MATVVHPSIVQLPYGSRLPSSDARLAWLEAQVDELKLWKDSLGNSLPITPAALDSPLPTSAAGSPRGSSVSLGSDDVPSLTSASAQLPPAVSSPAPPTKASSTEMPSRILAIIESYGHNEKNADGTAWLGRSKFETIVRNRVDANAPIDMVLPAFPWKSVNKVEKVLGALPDLGEELALARLQSLCLDIGAIYPPGAFVTITSDGLVYCDLVGIHEEEVYEYGKALRNMAVEKGFDRLKFIRIINLLGLADSPHMTKEEYLDSVDGARKSLMDNHLPADFDVRDTILNDPDVKLTYCGYIIFLTKDLKHSPIALNATSQHHYKRVVKRVAHDMITRGKAFAALVSAGLPDHVRLSIHRSTGAHKLSFPLIPQPDHFSMTPWHCSVAVTSKGQFCTAHASQVRERFDLIEQDGRPYYFRDRSDVWNWDVPVTFEFFYPKGVFVRAKATADDQLPKIGPKELEKVKQLGKFFSTVITLGFSS